MHWSMAHTLRRHVMHTRWQLCCFQFFERMPIHDSRLSVRRIVLNLYRSKHGAYSKVARCPNSNIGKWCMTWRCSCCVLYLRFAQETCFSTRSHWMKSQIERSFSITTTTLTGSRCTCATWWTRKRNTRHAIYSLLMDFSQCQNAKPFLNDWIRPKPRATE